MRRVAALVLCGLGLAGCGGGADYRASRRALERAGYRSVSVTVRSGAGLVVARVDGHPPGGASPDDAAATVWRTLPVRFDQLVLDTVPAHPSYRYQDLVARFGPRDPSLDRAPTQHTARSQLLGVIVVGAVLAGAGLVVGVALVRRGLRAPPEQLDQAEGSASGFGTPSPMAEGSAAADEAGEMPS
ncbi:MAG TPA: hypothetical protein VL337_18335 [Acidimicrobiales bacterium]|nr:hypothetical protein [Acidimicrobiales bacterium]